MALQLGNPHGPVQAGLQQCGIGILTREGDVVLIKKCQNNMVLADGVTPLLPGARGCLFCEPQPIPGAPAVAAAWNVVARPAIPAWNPAVYMTTNIAHFIVGTDLSRLAVVPQLFTWRIHTSVQPSYATLRAQAPVGQRPNVVIRCFEGTACENWDKQHQPDKTICLCGQSRCESYVVQVHELDKDGNRVLDTDGNPVVLEHKTSCWNPQTTLVSPNDPNVHLCEGCIRADRGFKECPQLFPMPAATQRKQELKEALELEALQRSASGAFAGGQPEPSVEAPPSVSDAKKLKGDFKITSRGFWPMNEVSAGFALRWSQLCKRSWFEATKVQAKSFKQALTNSSVIEFTETPAEPMQFWETWREIQGTFTDIEEDEDLVTRHRIRAGDNAYNMAMGEKHGMILGQKRRRPFSVVFRYLKLFRVACHLDVKNPRRVWTDEPDPEIMTQVESEEAEARFDEAEQRMAAKFANLQRTPPNKNDNKRRQPQQGEGGGGNQSAKKGKKNKQGNANGDKSKKRVDKRICFACNEPGHIALNCPENEGLVDDEVADDSAEAQHLYTSEEARTAAARLEQELTGSAVPA